MYIVIFLQILKVPILKIISTVGFGYYRELGWVQMRAPAVAGFNGAPTKRPITERPVTKRLVIGRKYAHAHCTATSTISIHTQCHKK